MVAKSQKQRKKILVFSSGHIGKAMAGPGIRYWEFAKILSAYHDVTLSIPNELEIETTKFEILSRKNSNLLKTSIKYDIIITQTTYLNLLRFADRVGAKIIIDAYGPILLEALEIFADESDKIQMIKNKRIYKETKLSFLSADAVICACDRQKDLWTGTLMALDRIRPDIYAADSSLKNIIDIVPFGMQAEPPKKTGEGLRKKFGIKESDKVILWGGGIWNWFDPLTLIKAMGEIAKSRDDIKLVFMGVGADWDKDDSATAAMAKNAINLAKKLELYGKTVFFNYGWVSYEQRANYWLDADFGVSTHFDHLETRFSFRTRILDYLWADLPIITTKGDTFAQLIEESNLGKIVDYEDIEGLANTITKLTDDPEQVNDIRQNISNIKKQYYWEEIGKKLVNVIDSLDSSNQGIKKITLTNLNLCLSILWLRFVDRYLQAGLKGVGKKIIKKTTGKNL